MMNVTSFLLDALFGESRFRMGMKKRMAASATMGAFFCAGVLLAVASVAVQDAEAQPTEPVPAVGAETAPESADPKANIPVAVHGLRTTLAVDREYAKAGEELKLTQYCPKDFELI